MRPSSSTRTRAQILSVALVCAALAHAGVALADETPSATGELRYRVEVGDAPTRGPADAPVTIVEFSDFLCPMCRRTVATFEDLRVLFPGKLRFAFRMSPLDPEDGTLPTEAALAARAQGRFWDMHERLFSRRQEPTREVLEGYAQEIGLDMAQFRQALDSRQHLPEVRRDATAIRSLGMTSVPVFFVNGRMLKGAHPVTSFARVISEELAHADSLRRAGVAPQGLYEAIVSNGKAFVDADGAEGEPLLRFGDDTRYRVSMSMPGHSRGPADALVTVVVFSEFECPFSAQAAGTLAALQREYPADLRLSYRHLPLRSHTRAHLAAEAAVAASHEGKFWEFHDLLYRHQGPRDRAVLEWYAERLGFDMDLFRAALDDRRFLRAVHADAASAYALGIGATPTFIVNGKVVRGALPYPQFKQVIEERLAEARALVKKGVPRAEVYSALVRDADVVESRR